jgi:subtilisin family serine protease
MLLACIVAALLGAPAAALAEDEPIDEYYPASVHEGGWLERIGWSWDAIQHAHYEDVAYPTIAVIDSGIDDEHPEFADDGVIDPASADCRSGRPLVSNGNFKRVRDLEDGHGTIVAGLAAAPANGLGIVGASPYSTLLVVRIVPNGLGGLACALDYLAAQMDHGPIGLLVVNLSLFDPRSPSKAVRRGIAKLVRRGALLVAATGNVGPTSGTRVGYPARLPHVLAIGDMERQALLKGTELDLLAPGGSLYSPVIGGSTGGWRPIGAPQTSYATGIASGAAAAVWGAHPEGSALTAQQVAWLLRATASSAKSWTRATGFGTINVGAALRFTRGIPADDESEPNDSASDASGNLALAPLVCPKTCTRHGIVGTTDDPEDWWAIRVPGKRKVCRHVGGPVSSSVVQGPKGLAYVRVTTKRASTGYTLKLRAGFHC